eukprot:6477130-Amphidinium_carterae.1
MVLPSIGGAALTAWEGLHNKEVTAPIRSRQVYKVTSTNAKLIGGHVGMYRFIAPAKLQHGSELLEEWSDGYIGLTSSWPTFLRSATKRLSESKLRHSSGMDVSLTAPGPQFLRPAEGVQRFPRSEAAQRQSPPLTAH